MTKRQMLIIILFYILCIVSVVILALYGLHLVGQVLKSKETPLYYIPQRETKISSAYTENYEDLYLLAQIIHAEAKGEPYEGKLAVGNVIHNRVKSKQFPNSIRDVIFQKGQFQPVMNGSIYNEPNEESIRAARESYHTNIIGPALYFYNPTLSTDTWITTRKTIKRIGSHVFAY